MNILPHLRSRTSRAKKIYESFRGNFSTPDSEYIKDPDFFRGYEDVIDIVDAVPSRGMLTVCPTPLGNLKDITLRQFSALKTGDILACEDTRVTGLLLNLLSTYNLVDPADIEFPPKHLENFIEFDEYTYGLTGDFISHTVDCIKKTRQDKGRGLMISFNSFNQEGRTPKLIKAMKSGLKVILVSDAGTPLISDPGYFLVKECVAAGVSIDPLPGGSAGLLALIASGFPSDNFFFHGYLPKTEGDKIEKLRKMKGACCTCVLYESSHRVLATLDTISAVFGKSHAVFIGKELTKMHQKMYRGSAAEVYKQLKEENEELARIYGELTVVVAPATDNKQRNTIEIEVERLVGTLQESVQATPTNMNKLIQRITGYSRNKVANLMTEEKDEEE